ncbi:hypothetical protein BDQ17DRAFT_1348498 [Cyathus striatus]|nr:hypothetical protein BDQ17DRAFT_1348498 [Cyathus striatus]
MSQTETAFTDPQTLSRLYESALKLPDDDCYLLDVSEWSIQAFQLAAILAPQHDQELLIFLLRSLDLNQAISTLQEGIGLTPENDLSLPDQLAYLAYALQTRFEQTEELRDITEAIELQGSRSRFEILFNLFDYTHELSDADEAIEIMQDLVNNMDPEDPQYSSSLNNLSCTFRSRFECSGDLRDRITCRLDIVIWRQVIAVFRSVEMMIQKCDGSTVIWICEILCKDYFALRETSLISLKQSLDICLHTSNTTSMMVSSCFVIPPSYTNACWVPINTSKQRATVGDVRATAVAIRYGQLHMAVEWLEQGRSIVWNQVNNFRAPLEDLRKVDPSLCTELEKIGIALQEASMRTNSSDLVERSMTHSVSIQDDQWDSLLCQVRSISGFENFLCPVPFFELVLTLPPSALTRGISADKVDVFAAVILRERLHRLLSDPSSQTRTVRTGRTATNILRELWYEIVKPIIDALNLESNWSLAFLPLHAAGDYYQHDKTPSSGSNIMDYAISSYTPTITALTQSISKHNQQKSRQPQEFKGLLTVSEPESPGLPSIPSTAIESCALKKLFDSFSYTLHSLDGVEATVKNVSDAMPLYSWIHLSCHALQNDSPLKKAIHLAAGMLAAGYTSVVATMWSISDIYAPQIAEEFYSYILQKEDESSTENSYPDCTRAAAALHHAIGNFRHLIGDDEDSLLLWIPYIHVGI